MQSRLYATDTATFTTNIKGAKDLKEYISKMNHLIRDVRAELENDIKQPLACVEEPNTFLGSRKFDVTMCRISHNDLVYSETVLPQNSKFLQAEQVIIDHMKALEGFRTMLVTNKQQKRTMLRNIRRIIASERSALALPPSTKTTTTTTTGPAGTIDQDEPFSCLLEYESPAIKGLKQIAKQLKQNHRTVARNIIRQIQPILLAMRTCHILAYKLAAENTIGKIIHHAQKCRSFIAHCRHIACIEYCASAWWMETQKDPMDHSPYYVTAISEGESKRFNASTSTRIRDISGFISEPPRIMLEIKSAIWSSDDDSYPTVFFEHMDQQLAETILTEEAVREFEAEELPTSYYREYGAITSKPPHYQVQNNHQADDNDHDDDDDLPYDSTTMMAWS